MQPNVPPSSAQPMLAPEHPHHRRIVIVVAIALAVIVIGAIIYQLIASGVPLFARKAKLMQQYQAKSLESSSAFFNEYGQASIMSDADKKAAAEFFKSHPAEPMTDEQARQQAEALRDSEDQAFKGWRSSR